MTSQKPTAYIYIHTLSHSHTHTHTQVSYRGKQIFCGGHWSSELLACDWLSVAIALISLVPVFSIMVCHTSQRIVGRIRVMKTSVWIPTARIQKHTNTHVQDRHTLIHMEKHTHTHPHIQALMNVLFSEG